MDEPDAGWIQVTSEVFLSRLVPAAGSWMTDGLIMFNVESNSLLSVDVEQRGDRSVIETTIIGDGLSALRTCFYHQGPAPLPVIAQKR